MDLFSNLSTEILYQHFTTLLRDMNIYEGIKLSY